MYNPLETLEDVMDEEFARADVRPLHLREEGCIRIRWPFGWEDCHIDETAFHPDTDGRPMSVFLYATPSCIRLRWGQKGLNDRLRFLIRRLLCIWGPQPPAKIHAGLGAEGASQSIGGLIGRMHEEGALEKRDGVWRYVGDVSLMGGVVAKAKQNADVWSSGT